MEIPSLTHHRQIRDLLNDMQWNYLRTNLVSALAGLKVDDFTHSDEDLGFGCVCGSKILRETRKGRSVQDESQRRSDRSLKEFPSRRLDLSIALLVWYRYLTSFRFKICRIERLLIRMPFLAWLDNKNEFLNLESWFTFQKRYISRLWKYDDWKVSWRWGSLIIDI